MKKESKTIQSTPMMTPPSNKELFMGFLSLSMAAFGGALPIAHHVLVTKRKWLKSEEFFEILALCQLLPGPNIINMGVIVGSRHHKIRGACSAVLGLMALPVLIVIGLAQLYTAFREAPLLQGILSGINPAAAGLMLAVVLQMMTPFLKVSPFFKKEAVYPLVFMMLSFTSVGIFHIPLPWVLLILVPLSIGSVWRKYKNETR